MPTQDLQQETPAAFETYLLAKAEKSRHHARKNDFAATACYVLALAGSFSASLCAALTDLPRIVLAALTAVPGAALLATSVFAYEKKCRWHRRRKLRYDSLVIRLKFEGENVATLGKELREFEEKMDREYPRFGSFVAGKADERE